MSSHHTGQHTDLQADTTVRAPGFATPAPPTAVTTSPGKMPPRERRGGSSPARSPAPPAATLCTIAPLGIFSVRATASLATCRSAGHALVPAYMLLLGQPLAI